ncbi:GNAT family N-acetyltransferase [Brevibacillus porteri]|uniref:GNAT family N-acetyltransferase n=1 Tax=Brevibacillus porteri TaxID=2126350 RepID=UPI0036441229
MLRQAQLNDKETIVAMIGEGMLWRTEEIGDIVEKATIYIWEENDQIIGCGTYDLNSSGEEGTAEIYVYTRPDHRERGIGSRLFDKLWLELQQHEEKPTAVMATYRVDHGQGADFFAKRGFASIWGHHLMKYTGEIGPEPTLDIRKFTESDMEMYIQSQSDAYYEVRKGIDLQPYRLADYPEKTMNAWKNWLLGEMREDIYLFEHEGVFVGSLIITGHGEVYDVFVDPVHQGKGYGKELVRFFVNRTLEKDLKPYLVTGTHNESAIALYERTGFQTFQTTTTAKRDFA